MEADKRITITSRKAAVVGADLAANDGRKKRRHD